MRIWGIAILVFVVAAMQASAELQQITVGGSIEIYGNYYTDFFDNAANTTRIPPALLRGRAIGPLGTTSFIRAYDDEDGYGNAWLEQRTTVHFNAQFTDDVSAYLELESIEDWGEDFRSPRYVFGVDQRADSSDDIEFYQAYIDIEQCFELPLQLRIGRQELCFGSEWLVGNNASFAPLTYLSFDALRLTHTAESYVVDAFAAKLNERYAPGDDVDFYGLYATYSGVKDWTFDGYWFLLRDGGDFELTTAPPFAEWLEGLLHRDSYDTVAIHTVGLRLAGDFGGFNTEVEAAYQWGDAGLAGAGFVPIGKLYGDTGAEYGAWAGHATLGYTFEQAYSPYIEGGVTYYGGEDRRDISFIDWLNPFSRPQASLSFNRLFSSWEEENFLDASALSNVWIAHLALSCTPTDAIEIGASVHYLQTLEAFDTPVWKRLGKRRLPLASPFPFLTQTGKKDLGWETTLWAAYDYSDDLSFECGWSHFFTGDAIVDGVFADANGLLFMGGLDDQDADYFWWGTQLTF